MLEKLSSQRILILDGAMGTMIQGYGLSEADYRGTRFAHLPGVQKGNNDLLTLTRPDIIADIHRRYLEAGADIIETNTFSAQRISMAEYHCQDLCRELNKAAVALAKELAAEYTRRTPEKPRLVAGSVGPTGKTLSMSPDVNDPALRALTFDALAEAYVEQMETLISEGVDALLIETIFDTLNAKAALHAAETAMQRTARRVPIMLSVTIADRAGRTLSGQTLTAFLASVAHADIFSVGLNCSFGAAEMRPFVEELARCAPYRISVYPNAGLPNADGGYDQTPEAMAEEMRNYVEAGLVNIIGGCCGTTDAYIAEYPKIIQKGGAFLPPHIPTTPTEHMQLAGLDLFELKPGMNFINVGERCNVAGSRKFLRLIKEKKYDEAVAIARRQVEDGAQIIDINMDDGLLDTREEMVHFLNLLAAEPEVARRPFMIDSSDWEVIRAALKCVQGKCIVNSLSLKEGEAVFKTRAAELRRMGAAVVIMAFDEEGQATTYERRIGICQRAYRILTEEVGFPACDIIFDPNILAICTGMSEHDDYARSFIEATRWIRENLPGAHVSGGVSNLSFSFRGNNYIREAMHAVFLFHAIKAGMDMGIVNPATAVMYEDIPAAHLEILEDVVLNRRPGADRLIALAESVLSNNEAATSLSQSNTTEAQRRECPVSERLSQALIKGVPDHLADDLTEALQQYARAVDIIEGPLMQGMNHVGELFGAGKMFLPQVVKTARTMKQAVDILQPHIEAQQSHQQNKAGRMVIATVKGDVHDIGKNIVGVVMGCNNYEVTDLGVMCPTDRIVSEAIRTQADFIGLSGLITPSLDEMIRVAQAMQAAGLRIPLIVGGATTGKLHTALHIAPAYDGPVIHVKDASQMVGVAAQLMNESTRNDFLKGIADEYQRLRNEHTSREANLLSLSEARNNKPQLF